MTSPERSFHVVTANVVQGVLDSYPEAAVDAVKLAYRYAAEKRVVNPDSYFLKFPDKANARIIALPSFVGGEVGLAGLKWISSFPDNVRRNMPRASAVLILNDYSTGAAIACLEGALISAERTAASAVISAEALTPYRTESIGFIGAGQINRRILKMFVAAR